MQRENKRYFTIGIAGASGAGKTTLARALINRLGPECVTYMPYDAYYRDQSAVREKERHLLNFDHPDALDSDLFVEHLCRLQSGHPIEMPLYDFATHTRTGETRRVWASPWILVEGILILAEAKIREVLDLRVFVKTDLDVCLIRRLQRDCDERGRSFESVIEQWERTVRPMYLEYVKPCSGLAHAVVSGVHYDEAVDQIMTRLKTLEERSIASQGTSFGSSIRLLDSREADKQIVTGQLRVESLSAIPIWAFERRNND